MDFATNHRKTGAKYGKSRGRPQIHNFYDISSARTKAIPGPNRLPISPLSPGSELPDQSDSGPALNLPSPSPSRSTRPAHITSHSRSSCSTSNESRSRSPTKSATKPSTSVEKSTFDMLSSDDDDDLELAERRPVKKLRLSPARPQEKQSVVKSRSKLVKKDEQMSRPVPAKKQGNVSTNQSQQSSGSVREVKKNASTDPIITAQPKANADLRRKVEVQPKNSKVTHSNKSRVLVKEAQPEEDIPMQDFKDPEHTPRTSRTKLRPRTKLNDSPKNKQHSTNDSDTSAASPSHIGLGQLRLTPEESQEVSVRPASPSRPRAVVSTSRGRKRLGDRLDTAASQITTVRAEVAARNFAKELDKLHQSSDTDASRAASDIPKLGRSGSSQTRTTYGRSKNTYAKERSHLSDMVDDLDALSNMDDQHGSQKFLAGGLSTGPSQLQSQFEMESDSSDDPQTFRLKNVHELRQVGSINRLGQEVEDLMSDVNPTKSSKATRIQSLMQILRKVSQETFAAFIFEHALDRLTTWSSSTKDKISKLLLGMIFWRLVHCNVTPPSKLRQIIQTVMANSSSIPPLDTIVQIAKTRAENLSKSTIQDLSEFEQTVVLEGLLPAYEGEGVIPAAITLGVLNDSLRKIVDAGTTISLPQSSYVQIVALLEQASHSSGDQAVKHVFVTKLALSLLQMCAGPLEQDLGLSVAQHGALGDNLAGVITRSLFVHESLVQAILHFMISLCNDRPDVCRAICNSKFTASLMSIIESRFLGLVDAADDSQTVESSVLDSIILTLACLLNLTEHDDEVRRSFAFSTLEDSGTTHLSRLIDMYTAAAPRLAAASTTEQGSALVVLGYLSLLICNLCLDDELWQYVYDHLHGQFNISDIVASAKELLIHLRTVETVEDMQSNERGNTALDGVTARFGEILNAVRLE